MISEQLKAARQAFVEADVSMDFGSGDDRRDIMRACSGSVDHSGRPAGASLWACASVSVGLGAYQPDRRLHLGRAARSVGKQ
jgi:hypothetical protein